MDGQNYVIFHNDGNDSYMNTTANFRGADVGTTFIDLFFTSATNSQTAFDKVRLTVTATYEEEALEAIAGFMAGSGPKGRVTVIADDKNTKYIHDRVTAVSAITLLGGNKSEVEVITSAKTLYSYDSGSTIFVNPAATMLIQLPAAAAGATTSFGGAGWNVQIVWQEDDGGTMDNIVNIGTASGEFFNGVMTSGDGGGSAIANGTSHDFLTVLAAATSGGSVRIVSDGTRMYAAGHCIDGTDAIFATAAAS
jgi:hypothetical protein